MSRRAIATLIIWLVTAVACGGDGPSPAPTVASGPTEATVTASGPENTGTDGTAATTEEAGPQEAGTQETGTEAGTKAATEPSTSAAGPETTEAPATTDPSAGSSTPAYSGPVSPITGLPVDDPSLIDRKVVAVKIDNHRNSRPQSGIERADAVFEVVVEGGFTRFIALFHQSDSDWVGPMRSARPTDWTLVRPLDGVLLISGGQPWITRKITGNGVPLIGDYGPPLTARWRERVAPHNLYVDTYEARRVVADRGLSQEPPTPLAKRGSLSGPEEAMATSMFFYWSETVDVVWRWDGAQYLRSMGGEPHRWRTREGDQTGQISADVLVVLMSERYSACPQGEGSCVPAWDTVGENRAIVFGEGRYVEGRWRRDRASDWFSLTDAVGNEITVPPGRMWIMIYPETAGLVW